MRKIIHTLQFTGIITIFLLVFQSASAQSGIIKGQVKDAAGNPLAGASVSIEGNKIGTITDLSGNYLLKLPSGKYTVVVTFVGQAPQRVPVIIIEGATLEQNFTTTEVYDQGSLVTVSSRSKEGRSKLTTPVPVDVIPVSVMAKEVAQVDLNQLLTYTAPSFQSSRQTI